jgi:hypothetical protein
LFRKKLPEIFGQIGMPLYRFRTPAIINHEATTIIVGSRMLTLESVMSSNVLTETLFLFKKLHYAAGIHAH